MRLGGPIFAQVNSPDEWALAVQQLGYSSTYCPLGPDSSSQEITAYRDAAKRADIVIAEVGAWSNPISRDRTEAATAIEKCQNCLGLADQIGALCCVNIAGSRGAAWDGPDPANDSDDTFDLIVQTVRQIIDAVKPQRAMYTLETMPWIPPDSPDSYLALLKAIDRKGFAVHLDPVNMINCPKRAYHTGDFLKECFAKLGPWIVGCHAKDIKFTQHLTLHLDECIAGTGVLDYAVFLREMAKLSPDIPLMLEHLQRGEDYESAADHIRKVADETGVTFR